MESVLTIRARIAPLAWRIRWHRAVHWSTRCLLYSLLASLPLLLVKPLLPWPPGLWLSGLVILSAGGGLLFGLARPVPLMDLARLIEERFGLQARLSTALECHGRQDRSPFALALYQDALKALPPFTGNELLPLRPPKQGWRLLPATVAVLLLLLYAPPLPWHRLGELQPSSKAEGPQEESSRPELEERTGGAAMIEAPRIRDRMWRGDRTPTSRTLREMDALFKDSPLADERPDFSSFLLGGDDRMRLLGRSHVIPNLRGENLRSPYQIMVQQMRELAGGGGIRRLTPDEAKQLLSEIQKMGKKGGSSGSADSWGAEELAELTPEGAQEALERALERLREREEAQLKSSEVPQGLGRGSPRGQGPWGGQDPEEDESGSQEMFGPLAGRGRSELLRGDPTPRLGTSARDTGLKGRLRDGRSQAYNTNLLGAGEGGKPTLPQADILTRYRQIMEEALSREPIPPDYREQVKAYFHSLMRSRGGSIQ
ncbi:MAG: hypothetical protein ACE5JQ_00600 [Candidatus Methylomirabilales bacterium]